MSWRDGFYEAVKNYLETLSYRPYKDIREVTGVDYDGPSEYYCDTCGPDPEQVLVTYIANNGHVQTATIYISLSDFINSLED